MRPVPARVVILGGGFAGIYAASYLAAADLPPDSLEVILVSDRNYFTFTPLLAEVVAGSLGREDVTLSLPVFGTRRGFRFIQARVEGIDAFPPSMDGVNGGKRARLAYCEPRPLRGTAG